MKSNKERLVEELRKIEEQELSEFIETHYAKFKAMEGKCFKFRNCYSCPENEDDYWDLYVKITKIEKENLYKMGGNPTATFTGWSFQTDNKGKINIDPDYFNYVHSLSSYMEISNDEFKEAWFQLQKNLAEVQI